MANPLPLNIVKSVVREWLSSKENQLNGILADMVEHLTPIAQERCREMLASALGHDWRDELIAAMQSQLERVRASLEDLRLRRAIIVHAEAERTELHQLVNELTVQIEYARERLAGRDPLTFGFVGSPGGKGGVA